MEIARSWLHDFVGGYMELYKPPVVVLLFFIFYFFIFYFLFFYLFLPFGGRTKSFVPIANSNG